MDRPLWQILLSLFVLSFVLHRGAAAVVLTLGDPHSRVLAAGYGLQVAAGLALALGIWLGRRWAIAAAVAVGICVAATAVLEGMVLGLRPPVTAVSTTFGALLATGGLALVLHHEFGGAGRGGAAPGERDVTRPGGGRAR